MDAWRELVGEQVFPEPMPWYFRTLATWLADLDRAGFSVHRLREPAHPDTARPLSLLLEARASDA